MFGKTHEHGVATAMATTSEVEVTITVPEYLAEFLRALLAGAGENIIHFAEESDDDYEAEDPKLIDQGLYDLYHVLDNVLQDEEEEDYELAGSKEEEEDEY